MLMIIMHNHHKDDHSYITVCIYIYLRYHSPNNHHESQQNQQISKVPILYWYTIDINIIYQKCQLIYTKGAPAISNMGRFELRALESAPSELRTAYLARWSQEPISINFMTRKITKQDTNGCRFQVGNAKAQSFLSNIVFVLGTALAQVPKQSSRTFVLNLTRD